MQTLEIARELQQAGISENSAYEMAEVINGRSGLATKEDLAELKAEVKENIHNVEKNLEGQIHAVREEIIKLEGKLDNRIGKLDNRMGKLETSNKWLVAIQLAILALLLKDVFLQ